jgi:superfamily II DNA or RNA helicase
MITLRPYQVTAVETIRSEWTHVKATLAALATGTGKTEIGTATIAAEWEAAQDAGQYMRVLWLVHRIELADQPVERWARNWSHALPSRGIVMADRDDKDRGLVVATVQTLSASGYKRLDEVLRYGRFTHLVIDETHRAVARTYKGVLERLRRAEPNLRILGLTATPKRTDGDGLKQVFDSVAVRYSIKDAIKLGALCPFVAMGVQLPISIADVPVKGKDGEWDGEILGSVLDVDNARQIIDVEQARGGASNYCLYCIGQASAWPRGGVPSGRDTIGGGRRHDAQTVTPRDYRPLQGGRNQGARQLLCVRGGL